MAEGGIDCISASTPRKVSSIIAAELEAVGAHFFLHAALP
jgi:hypothetical protein